MLDYSGTFPISKMQYQRLSAAGKKHLIVGIIFISFTASEKRK
jgi:hypothetical protein